LAAFISLALLPDVAATAALLFKVVGRETLQEIAFEDCFCYLSSAKKKVCVKNGRYQLSTQREP
jgi:hypothetical protein